MSLHVAGDDGQWQEVAGVTNLQPAYAREPVSFGIPVFRNDAVPEGKAVYVDPEALTFPTPFAPELWADAILNAQAQTYVALFTLGGVPRPRLTRRQRLVRAISRPFRRLRYALRYGWAAFVDEWRSW